MGDIIPIKCLMVLESWASQWQSLSGSAEGTCFYSAWAATDGHWRQLGNTPCFIALLCYGRERPGRKTREWRSELSAACEMSPAEEQLWGRWYRDVWCVHFVRAAPSGLWVLLCCLFPLCCRPAGLLLWQVSFVSLAIREICCLLIRSAIVKGLVGFCCWVFFWFFCFLFPERFSSGG